MIKQEIKAVSDNGNNLYIFEEIFSRIAGAVIPDASFVNFTKEDIRVFFDFAQQLTLYDRNDKLPPAASQNVVYYLKIKKERLKKRGLDVKYNFAPAITENAYMQSQKQRVVFVNKGMGIIGKKYSCLNFNIPFEKQMSIYHNGNCVFSEKKTDVVLHQTAVKLNDGKMGDQIDYACPGCGAVSKVSILLNGCPYCGNYFIMSDLFPKITDFYFTQEFSVFPELEGKKKGFFSKLISRLEGKNLIQASAPLIIFCVVGAIVVQAVKGEITDGYTLFGTVVMGVYGAFFVGVFLLMAFIVCFMFYAPFAICKFFIRHHRQTKKNNPHKSVSMELKNNSAYKKLYNFMKEYYPNFSMEYFRNKIVSYLKTILVSEDIDNLSFYHGTEKIKSFDEIVDADFSGYMDLISYSVRKNYCYLTLDFYMVDLWDKGEKIEKRADVFRVSVCKDLNVEEDPESSIDVVKCPHCGGSFNASKEKHCPQCGMEYDMLHYDWVVTKVELIR